MKVLTIHDLWKRLEQEPLSRVALLARMTPKQLVWQFRKAGLYGSGEANDPSLADIRRGCREIRKRWTDTVREHRLIGRRANV